MLQAAKSFLGIRSSSPAAPPLEKPLAERRAAEGHLQRLIDAENYVLRQRMRSVEIQEQTTELGKKARMLLYAKRKPDERKEAEEDEENEKTLKEYRAAMRKMPLLEELLQKQRSGRADFCPANADQCPPDTRWKELCVVRKTPDVNAECNKPYFLRSSQLREPDGWDRASMPISLNKRALFTYIAEGDITSVNRFIQKTTTPLTHRHIEMFLKWTDANGHTPIVAAARDVSLEVFKALVKLHARMYTDVPGLENISFSAVTQLQTNMIITFNKILRDGDVTPDKKKMATQFLALFSCGICESGFNVDDPTCAVNCSNEHRFHLACMQAWCKKQPPGASCTCPECKTNIQTLTCLGKTHTLSGPKDARAITLQH